MNNLMVKFKRTHPDAIVPCYATKGDAGLDLTAVSVEYDVANQVYVYNTGISIEIPEGYYGQLVPRSSIKKTGMRLVNSPGTIDSSYRGNVLAVFSLTNKMDRVYKVGEKIAQLIILPYPNISLQEVQELSETKRGKGGFGSTGA